MPYQEFNLNPLGEFASYNYQISWYAATPDAYEGYASTGGTDISLADANGVEGVALIAQSGGINETLSERAEGFELDYYIDDLKIHSVIGTSETGTSSMSSEISFNIIEPYGFSFITNLRRALDNLKSSSSTPGYSDLDNGTRNFFILGIRFQGFDITGKLVTGPNNAPFVYEKYYGIRITEIKFKLDGKPVVYSIKAVPVPDTTMNETYSTMNTQTTTTGMNVKDALDDLARQLNNQQAIMAAKSQNNIEQPIHYEFLFEGEGSDEISYASIILPTDKNKSKTEGSGAKNTIQSNPTEAVRASYNPETRQFQFKNGTSVLQAIEIIISQSTYLSDGLQKQYTTELEPSMGAPDQIPGSGNKRLRWYNVSTRSTNPRFDTKTKIWAYDIAYVIQPYKTPITMAAAAGKTDSYYGPVKRYEYWLTGHNTEVLNFEVTFNNLFYTVGIEPAENADGSTTGGPRDVPQQPNKNPPFGTKLNRNDRSAGATNAYLTSLYDPGAWSKGKITIMGDPHFLISSELEEIVSSDMFEGDGTVNPRSGQVFIEVNFYEGYDYEHERGLFIVNDSIYFFPYPDDIQQELDERGGGVIFQVVTVTSFFRGGKFTQDLELVQSGFPDTNKDEDSATSPSGQVTGWQADR